MQKRTDIAPTQPLDQASLDLAQALGLVRTQVGVGINPLRRNIQARA